MDMEKGTVVGGRFVLDTELGRGGFGTVWRARHKELDEDFALKLLNPDVASDDGARKRFLREVKAATSFVHAYAVQVREFGRDEATGCLYFSMDLVDGTSLEDVLKREKTLAPGRVAQIGEQVCAVLAKAHAAGLVHRDLKPANLMLTSGVEGAEEARVLDFGIAKAIDPEGKAGYTDGLTLTGMTIGTLPYMSPEQAQGKKLDGRSDLYSLGAILYEALAGRRPIQADPDAENARQSLLFRLVAEEPIDLAELAPNAPKALREAVMRALAKSADDRFPDARAFEAALKGQDGSGSLEVPDGGPEHETVPMAAAPEPDRNYDRDASTEAMTAGVSVAGPQGTKILGAGTEQEETRTDPVHAAAKADPQRAPLAPTIETAAPAPEEVDETADTVAPPGVPARPVAPTLEVRAPGPPNVPATVEQAARSGDTRETAARQASQESDRQPVAAESGGGGGPGIGGAVVLALALIAGMYFTFRDSGEEPKSLAQTTGTSGEVVLSGDPAEGTGPQVVPDQPTLHPREDPPEATPVPDGPREVKPPPGEDPPEATPVPDPPPSATPPGAVPERTPDASGPDEWRGEPGEEPEPAPVEDPSVEPPSREPTPSDPEAPAPTPTAVGDLPPPPPARVLFPYALSLSGLDGKRVEHTFFKGRVVVVLYWASWSKASLEVLDALVALRTEVGEALAPVAVAMDEEAVAKRELGARGATFPAAVVSDRAKLEEQVPGFRGLPTLVVLDKWGRARATHLGQADAAKLRSFVEPLLAEGR